MADGLRAAAQQLPIDELIASVRNASNLLGQADPLLDQLGQFLNGL